MKAARLPSGNYRCQVYIGKDESGKRQFRSFTASSAADAELQALEFKIGKAEEEKSADNPTVADAIDKFIKSRSHSISPTTVMTYTSMQKNAYSAINSAHVRDLNTLAVQRWVNDYSAEHSPKMVRNAYALLMSSVKMFREWNPRIKLPQKVRPKYHVITDEELQRLLEQVKGTQMEAIILLAAFMPARRSEILALEDTDIDRKKCTVSVNKALVKGPDGCVLKPPKTDGGYRKVLMPKEIIEKIPAQTGRVFSLTLNGVEKKFHRALEAAGMKGLFRFHDLRHYGASWLHNNVVPEKIIQARGGWSSSEVLDRIYEHSMTAAEVSANELLSAHFEELSKPVQHDFNTTAK